MSKTNTPTHRSLFIVLYYNTNSDDDIENRKTILVENIYFVRQPDNLMILTSVLKSNEIQ